MDVCDEKWVEYSKDNNPESRALAEQDILENIEAADIDYRLKCEALWALIDRETPDEIKKKLMGGDPDVG